MVKLTGPGLGSSASGSLGKALIFSSNKGRAYLKKHAKPKQPRTGRQISIRAMMRFLSESWSQIATDRQDTWLPPARAGNVSLFNAYQGYNLNRWRHFNPPTQAWPAGEVLEFAHDPVLAAWGHTRHAKLNINYSTHNHDNWCAFLFHFLEVPPPAMFETLVHVHYFDGLTTEWWTHSPLPAGTHGYRLCFSSEDGNWDPAQDATDTCVVT